MEPNFAKFGAYIVDLNKIVYVKIVESGVIVACSGTETKLRLAGNEAKQLLAHLSFSVE